MDRINFNRRLFDGIQMRLMCVVTVLLMSVSAAFADGDAASSDTTYTFRFYRGSTKLFVPTFGNDTELERLEACVARYADDIQAGRLPLYVDGYCDSYKSEERNLEIARGRSNRVKSELITRQGLREGLFVTHNHSGEGNFVIVRLISDATVSSVHVSPEYDVEEYDTVAVDETPHYEGTMTAAEPAAPAAPAPKRFSLRANLLRWATLTPDLGIEWRANDRWSLLFNASWTTWSWNDKDRRYALREFMPEVRYHFGAEKHWGGYLGLQFKTGAFNYKFSETGKQGDIIGGGVTGGYVLRLTNNFSLDFSLGLGYLHADYDEYVVDRGVRLRCDPGTRNWWGPTHLGVSLVWNLF